MRRIRDSIVTMAIRGVRRLQMGAYTAGSAVVCLDPSRQLVLLVRPTYLSVWIFPGGFKNRRESPEAAALRELKEELGVTRIELHQVGMQFQAGRRHIDVVFVASMTATEAKASPSLEIRTHRWVPTSEAHSMLNEDGRRILSMALSFEET